MKIGELVKELAYEKNKNKVQQDQPNEAALAEIHKLKKENKKQRAEIKQLKANYQTALAMVEKLNSNSVFNPTDTAGVELPLKVEDHPDPI